MSHIVTVKAKIDCLQSVKEACDELGWTFQEAKTFSVWDGDKPCDFKIVLQGSAYEIGLIQEDNHLVPQWDDMCYDYNRHVEIREENGVGGFLQTYEKMKVRRTLKKRGLKFTERIESGKVKFEVQA